MDQNVINLVKIEYKKRLLSQIVAANSEQEDISTSIKSVTLRDAVVHLQLSWDAITPSSIEKCWRKIMQKDDEFNDEDNVPPSILRSDILSAQRTRNEIRGLLNCIPGGNEVVERELNSWLNCESVLENEIQITDDESEDAEIEEIAKPKLILRLCDVLIYSLIGHKKMKQGP